MTLKDRLRLYFQSKIEEKKNEDLIRQMDEEISKQKSLGKQVEKNLDEFLYIKAKKHYGEYIDLDQSDAKVLKDEYYIKDGRKKHFSKNPPLQLIFLGIAWRFTILEIHNCG